MSESADRPVGELSFEEALAALEGVVTRLEDGRVPLEQSIALYQRGADLRARCEALLADAELRVQRIMADETGAVTGLADAEAPAAAAPSPSSAPSSAPPAAPPAAAPRQSGASAAQATGVRTDDDDIPF